MVVGDFGVDVFVGAGDEFGAADDAADHAEELRDVLVAQLADDAVAIGVNHGADAFVREEFIDEDALLAAVEDVDTGDSAVAGFCSGDEEFASGDVLSF